MLEAMPEREENTSEGQTIWIADAHRDGKRFAVRADEPLTAFLELARMISTHLLTTT